MGYYIETGTQRGKARIICADHNGQYVSYAEALNVYKESPRTKAVIIVVNNISFEAAGFAYSEQEFKIMMRPEDARPKVLLTIPWDTAVELTGYKE